MSDDNWTGSWCPQCGPDVKVDEVEAVFIRARGVTAELLAQHMMEEAEL